MVVHWTRSVSAALLFLLVVATGACSHSPQKRAQALCPDCQALVLQSKSDYPLLAYIRHASNDGNLYIYLEGDGQPYRHHYYPTENPTSKQLTALKLMSLDSATSIYLNRPCYGYKRTPSNCSEKMWTTGRYSQKIVDSLNEAISEVKKTMAYDKLVLIGHSGGGTLALLIAQERDDVAAIITLAANLNHRHWTELMGYGPLKNSQNPSDSPLLAESVVRWHIAAGKDRQVPPEVVQTFAAQDPYARYSVEPDFDHQCCWQKIWPDLLQDLRDQLTGTK